ncbi:MAG: sulfatase-like hydrolase/transferase [Myxococcales bacterium]|nr:sulfatase-like hydrolase/transferase [Myxococcales bacterium]
MSATSSDARADVRSESVAARRVALGAIVGAAFGAIDGVVATVRTARGELTSADRATIVALGVVAASLLVTLLGALFALGARAVAARGLLRDAREYIVAGPSRWFARNERLALRVVMGIVGATTAGLVGFRFALGVVRSVRTPTLAALSIVGLGALSLVIGAFCAIVAGLALEGALRRSKRLASVGAVASVVALALSIAGLALAIAGRAVLARLSAWPPLALVAMVLTYFAIERAAAKRRWRFAPWTAVVASASVLFGLAWSAATLGRSQPVLDAVTGRSIVAARVFPSLQRWSDRDGDGYGRFFGGGDCNDRDPMINPMARDIPGNGRDENCTGIDAPAPPEDRPPPFVAPATPRPSVVLLSIDTMRPDHTSLHGYHRQTTPVIDRFAQNAARFDRAYAVAPQTVRSFAGAFTGRTPAGLCWGRDVQFPPLRDPNEMLAEVLRAEGYATAAFTNTSYFGLTAGFFQGFEKIEQGGGFKDDAPFTADHAKQWIVNAAREARPFFAWLHLVDPHEPYTDRTSPQDFGHEAIDRYDEEIAHSDAVLGRVIPALDEIAAHRPLVVIVMSDHGEGFGEHGVVFHSFDAHEEALRSVLVVRGPGVIAGPRNALVSLIDLYPTLLAYVGRTPTLRSPSRSLLPLLQAAPGANVPWRGAVFADVSPSGDSRPTSVALVAPPWKLIHDATRGAWELYQLDRDPLERSNVFHREPAVAEQLRARLADLARPSIAHCPRR